MTAGPPLEVPVNHNDQTPHATPPQILSDVAGQTQIDPKPVAKKPAKKPKKKRGVAKARAKQAETSDNPDPIIKKPENPVEQVKKPGMKLTFALSEKQQLALNATEKYVLYGGAKGGGKSWFLCIWMFLKALQNKGNKLFFCRKRSVDFTNTTLETWKKSIPAKLYRINEQKKKIYVKASNSVIDFGGLDDPQLVQSLNSAEYAHIGVDQAEEIERDQFSMLIGTLRHKLPGSIEPDYQIRLTANPAQCWLKDYFLLNPEPETRYIQALPVDNPELPRDYVKSLEQAFKHRPALLEAYLRGSWDDLSNNDTCIRGKWIEEAKTRKPEGRTVKRIVVNDPAITGDENVCFLMEQRGNLFAKTNEMIIEHKRPIETAALIASFRRLHKAQLIAVDSIGIGQGVIDGLNALNEPILPINSSSRPTTQNKQVRYANLRTQMWWEASEKFAENRICLPSDDFELARQLGVVRFEPSTTGRLLVQDKKSIKKSLGRSPDRADAFVMGLYALDYCDRLDQAEYEERSTDRAGYGIPIQPYEDAYVGVGEDYSGYNL